MRIYESNQIYKALKHGVFKKFTTAVRDAGAGPA